MWLDLEEILKEIRKETDSKWIKLEDVKHIATKHYAFENDEAVEVFLTFYHSLGEFFFFKYPKLPSVVILDPQLLIDAFRSVITIPRYHDCQEEFSELWMKLDDEGILFKDLVDGIWRHKQDLDQNKEVLLQIMVNTHLICPIPSDKADICKIRVVPLSSSQMYFVPCLLKNAKPGDILPRSDGSPEPLVYQGKGHFFPESLFHRLIACCFEKWDLHKKKLFSNYACFMIDDEIGLVISIKLSDVQLNNGMTLEMHMLARPQLKTWSDVKQPIVETRNCIEKYIGDLKRQFWPKADFQYCAVIDDEEVEFTKEDILNTRKQYIWGSNKGVSKTIYKHWFSGIETEENQDTIEFRTIVDSEWLTKNHVRLIKELHPVPILDYLFQENVLDANMYEAIRGENITRREIVRKLLFTLPSLATQAMTTFRQALIETNQSHLLDPPALPT